MKLTSFERKEKENSLKTFVLHSNVSQNQPGRCRFYKVDMVKHVASVVY